MSSDIRERYQKQLATSRAWLEGRRYFKAIEALEMQRALADGYRKDLITPKFHHQLSVARLLSTLEGNFLFPEETIAAGYLHDILEDHSNAVTREMLTLTFGERISTAVWHLSKKNGGISKTSESYYAKLAECPIASLVKCADRNHNIQTMDGVFTPEKQMAYIGEVETWYYPLIREARHAFPRQYPAYENMKIILRCQCRLIAQIHNTETK